MAAKKPTTVITRKGAKRPSLTILNNPINKRASRPKEPSFVRDARKMLEEHEKAAKKGRTSKKKGGEKKAPKTRGDVRSRKSKPRTPKEVSALGTEIVDVRRQIGVLSQQLRELASSRGNPTEIARLQAELQGTLQAMKMREAKLLETLEQLKAAPNEELRKQIEDLSKKIDSMEQKKVVEEDRMRTKWGKTITEVAAPQIGHTLGLMSGAFNAVLWMVMIALGIVLVVKILGWI